MKFKLHKFCIKDYIDGKLWILNNITTDNGYV